MLTDDLTGTVGQIIHLVVVKASGTEVELRVVRRGIVGSKDPLRHDGVARRQEEEEREEKL